MRRKTRVYYSNPDFRNVYYWNIEKYSSHAHMRRRKSRLRNDFETDDRKGKAKTLITTYNCIICIINWAGSIVYYSYYQYIYFYTVTQKSHPGESKVRSRRYIFDKYLCGFKLPSKTKEVMIIFNFNGLLTIGAFKAAFSGKLYHSFDIQTDDNKARTYWKKKRLF